MTLSLVWALGALPDVAVTDPELAAPPSREEEGETGSFDRAAFAARIWNPPPPPAASVEVSAPPEKPPPPPRLQLIGIVHDTGGAGAPVLRAALYDPATDRLHLVASGETIGPVTVSRIDKDGVSLDSGGRASRLALRDDPPGGAR